MSTVYFKDTDHIYTTGQKYYQSVSGLWKPYFSDFNAEEVSIKKAFKELDTENYVNTKQVVKYHDPDFIDALQSNTDMDIQLILDQAQEYRDSWIAKAQHGTDFHSLQERKEIEEGSVINPFTGKKHKVITWSVKKGYDNQSFEGNMFKDLPDGYVPEHLVKDDDSETAGQLDRNFIETIGRTRFIDIDDWKTDENIVLKPEFFHPKTGYQTMKYPFDHLYETNYWKYTNKISTYAKMLEKQGFTVRNLSITHVKIDQDLNILYQKRYQLPYKSFEAELALKFRQENLHISK